MLQQLFQHSGTTTFLHLNDKQYSYQWLQQKVKKTAGFFQSQGLQEGDRILLAVSDEVEMSVIFLSALAAGIVTVIADPNMKLPRARAIAERSRPACIIADKEALDNWQLTSSENTRIIPYIHQTTAKPGLLSKFLQKNTSPVLADHYKALLERSLPVKDFPDAPLPDDIAYILFTSGTTADSKGVVITHGNLSAHLATLQKVYGLNRHSTILNQLLLCHADGCIQGPLLAAFTGCTWHRPFRFSIETIQDLLDYCYANNISHLFVVPAMLNMLLQFSDGYEDSFQYAEFRALISVSAHLDAPLWDRFESVFKVPVSNVYGLTETVAGSLFCGPLKETCRKHTVGKPVDCEIRIVNDLGEEIAHGETGELCLRGAHVMKEYWNDVNLTNEAIRSGWFFTGDLASVDEEGFVTIKGRKKNLIISGGINIQPEEVTECLLRHPEIMEACALGFPDEVFGEKLIAAVILNPASTINSIQITEYCREFLDDKKVPHKIFILPEFPRGISGKVQLNILKDLLSKQQTVKQETNGQYREEVIGIAAEAFQIPANKLNIRDTTHSIGGWDSLSHLLFITSLEEKFKTRFTTAEIITMNSIQRAVELVEMKTMDASKY